MSGVAFEYIDATGDVFTVATANRTLTDYSGMGMPPVEHFWQDVPDRDGAEHLGHRFGNRTVNIVTINNASSRTEAWTNAGSYHRTFNPTLGVGTLKATLPDGSERELPSRIAGGLGFDTEERLPPTVGQMPIQLVSEEPHWRDSNRKVQATSVSASGTGEVTCANEGDVKTWPRITITPTTDKPLSHPVVELRETGDQIDLDVNLTGADSVSIDCKAPSVSRQDGTDLMGSATSASKFFSLRRGANTVQFTAGTGAGTCTVRWHDRYTGLYISPTPSQYQVAWTRGYEKWTVEFNQSTDTWTKSTAVVSESWS